MWNDIAFSFQQGNIYLIGVFGLAFIACVVILERLIMYVFIYNIDYKKFITELRKMLLSKDYERAYGVFRMEFGPPEGVLLGVPGTPWSSNMESK